MLSTIDKEISMLPPSMFLEKGHKNENEHSYG